METPTLANVLHNIADHTDTLLRFLKEEGLDPTGARVAFETINDSNIESVLADKRKALAQNLIML